MSNCSVRSNPTFKKMNLESTYEIKTIRIEFSQFSLIRYMKRPCKSPNEDVDVYLTCGGSYIYGKQVSYINEFKMTGFDTAFIKLIIVSRQFFPYPHRYSKKIPNYLEIDKLSFYENAIELNQYRSINL